MTFPGSSRPRQSILDALLAVAANHRDQPSNAPLSETIDIFTVLVDPPRPQILRNGKCGELAAGEIAAKVPISGLSVPRQLSVVAFLSAVYPEQIVLRSIRCHRADSTRQQPSTAVSSEQRAEGGGQLGRRNLPTGAWRDAPTAFYRAAFPAQNAWGTENAAHRITLPSRNTTVTADVAVTSTFFDALPPGSAQPDSVATMRDVPITRSVMKK